MKSKIQSWKNLVRFVQYYFSISGLLRTLFVPWHRDEYKTEPGLWGFFEKLSFQIITRIIGFVIRLVTILIALFSLLLCLILFPLFLIFPIHVNFEELVKIGSLGREWAYPITFTLNRHGRDMRLLPEYLVIDHDHAIEQIERTLSRKTQQNVLIVGSAGIGKTTRLSYLARKMYRDISAPALNGKRLVELFPEEMSVDDIEKCIKEAIDARNVILVIENIERFKILSILEPYMDNHHFQMILTTDYASYHADFKHRGNLMRVSEVVEFYPPDDETTMLYLIDWCQFNKESHRFSDETLAAIVILTDKLIMNAYQPEKSIDILEELSSLNKKDITPEDVEVLLSQKTGVPLGALRSDEKNKLINLEDVLKSHVIGQDEAVQAISSALKRSRAGVVDNKKPIGSFLFLGTTGVGKTHTAKMLAQYYFGGENMMIRFDMSEFRELSSMSRFIERLSAAIENTPYSLVFFDEIEKAHADILNLFLQMLDEGVLHTQSGRTISFRNTIIICTSNAGASYMMENDMESQDMLIQHIVSGGILKPEFINRFSATILYKALDRESIKKVARIMLTKLNKHLDKKQNLTINITDELVEYISRKGHDPKFGVRPLARVIQDEIETYIADQLLADLVPENRVIQITFKKDSE